MTAPADLFQGTLAEGLEALAALDDQGETDPDLADALVARFPEAAAAWAARARTHLLHGDFEAAAADNQAALARDPQSPDAAWNTLYVLDAESDDATAVLNAARKAVSSHPQHFGLNRVLGWVASQAGRQEEALAAWERAMAARPGNLQILTNLINTYGERDEVAAMKAVYARYQAAGGDEGLVDYNLGTALYQQGHYAEAIGYLDLGRQKLGPQNAIQHNRALCLEKLGRHEEAVAEWSHLLTREPDWDWPRQGRHRSLRELGRLQEARADLDILLAEDPNELAHLEYDAQLSLREGRPAAAQASLERILAQHGEDCNAVHYHLLGLCHLEQGRLEAAQQALDQALGHHENHFPSHQASARLALARRDPRAAQRHAEIAIALNPHDWAVYEYRAQALLAQQKPDKAADTYRLWLKFHPGDAQGTEALASLAG